MKTSRSALLSLAVMSVTALPLLGQSGADVAREYREANEAQLVRDFRDLLSYPNRARDTEDIPPLAVNPLPL